MSMMVYYSDDSRLLILYISAIVSQALKAGVINGRLLIDFLCQPGPRLVGEDVHAFRHKNLMFAEKLGQLRLQWLHVQTDVESQVSSSVLQ